MAWHDAAMHRFGQWWKRAVRAGHSYAEGMALHGRAPERHYVCEVRSILAWGVALPAIAAAFAWPTRGLSLLLLCAYAVLWLRVFRGRRSRGDVPDAARLYATFIVLGKPAGAVGVWKYFWGRRVMRRAPRIIEYKKPGDGADAAVDGVASRNAAPRC
jgi:hypothetical protein